MPAADRPVVHIDHGAGADWIKQRPMRLAMPTVPEGFVIEPLGGRLCVAHGGIVGWARNNASQDEVDRIVQWLRQRAGGSAG